MYGSEVRRAQQLTACQHTDRESFRIAIDSSAEDNEEALLSVYPPVGLLDAKRIKQTEEKRKQPYIPDIPGLNAEALRLGRVKNPD